MLNIFDCVRWDHLFLDVLMTNTPGIILGTLVVRYTGVERYDFFGRYGAKSFFDWKAWHW